VNVLGKFPHFVLLLSVRLYYYFTCSNLKYALAWYFKCDKGLIAVLVVRLSYLMPTNHEEVGFFCAAMYMLYTYDLRLNK
jgi:hypothetical protein